MSSRRHKDRLSGKPQKPKFSPYTKSQPNPVLAVIVRPTHTHITPTTPPVLPIHSHTASVLILSPPFPRSCVLSAEREMEWFPVWGGDLGHRETGQPLPPQHLQPSGGCFVNVFLATRDRCLYLVDWMFYQITKLWHQMSLPACNRDQLVVFELYPVF